MSFKVSVFPLSLPVYSEKVLSFSSKYLHVIFWKCKHFKFWEICSAHVFSTLREQGSLFHDRHVLVDNAVPQFSWIVILQVHVLTPFTAETFEVSLWSPHHIHGWKRAPRFSASIRAVLLTISLCRIFLGCWDLPSFTFKPDNFVLCWWEVTTN